MILLQLLLQATLITHLPCNILSEHSNIRYYTTLHVDITNKNHIKQPGAVQCLSIHEVKPLLHTGSFCRRSVAVLKTVNECSWVPQSTDTSVGECHQAPLGANSSDGHTEVLKCSKLPPPRACEISVRHGAYWHHRESPLSAAQIGLVVELRLLAPGCLHLCSMTVLLRLNVFFLIPSHDWSESSHDCLCFYTFSHAPWGIHYTLALLYDILLRSLVLFGNHRCLRSTALSRSYNLITYIKLKKFDMFITAFKQTISNVYFALIDWFPMI